jgi:thiamine pyrophosphokinase
MRGIAFIGGEAPPPALTGRLLARAAAEPGGVLIAAADSGLVAAEAAGVRPGWIIGDMDSLDPRRLEAYPPERVLRHSHNKDYTDTELALDLLRARGCAAIWLFGGGGGRTDHLLALVSLFERRTVPERWLTAGEDIRALRAGEEAVFELSDIAGPVSVFPLGRGPWKMESRGLRWPLDNFPWRRGVFSISNERAAPSGSRGSFHLRAARGRFLVLLPLPVYI